MSRCFSAAARLSAALACFSQRLIAARCSFCCLAVISLKSLRMELMTPRKFSAASEEFLNSFDHRVRIFGSTRPLARRFLTAEIWLSATSSMSAWNACMSRSESRAARWRARRIWVVSAVTRTYASPTISPRATGRHPSLGEHCSQGTARRVSRPQLARGRPRRQRPLRQPLPAWGDAACHCVAGSGAGSEGLRRTLGSPRRRLQYP